MVTKNPRCRAKNPSQCRIHGTPLVKPEASYDFLLYETEILTAERKNQTHVTLPPSEPYPKYRIKDEQEMFERLRKKHGTVVIGGKEITLGAPDGRTQYCLSCEEFLPKDNPLTADKPLSFPCPSCGEYCDDGLVGVALAQKDFRLLNENTVRTTRWYHTSRFQDWDKKVTEDGNNLVHLGSKEAALDRNRDIQQNEKHRSRFGDAEAYMYEMELVEDCPVSASVLSDDPYNDDPSTPEITENSADHPDVALNGVTRYVNYFEDVGSISLLANPKRFRVISKQKLG